MTIATKPCPSIRSLPRDLECIFREHYAFAYRTAFRTTGNAADAEDVLQTLFLRLFRREFPPNLEKAPKAYLYRAAVNIALDVIRSRNVHAGEPQDMELLAAASPVVSRGDEELHARLRAALAELRPKAAEIFILRHVHGYTDMEIAHLLGTSRGTIAVSLFRSRVRLRRLIKGRAGEDS